MKTGFNGYRVVILVGISLLIFLLAVSGLNLFSQLRDLSTAEDDNTQWSISQLDTEFANLNATLSKQRSDGTLSDDEIRLRIDIAISRLGILTTGRSSSFFMDHSQAQMLIGAISEFADKAVVISDLPGPLTGEQIRELQLLTEQVRPDVRKISLLGVEIGADRADAQRAEFARQLTRTGSTTIALLVLMAVLMLVLDRLLHRAGRRDAELLTSSQLLESTIAASLDAIVTANDKGEIIEFNDAAEGVFGWSRDEMIGDTMENTFIPHRMRDAHHAGMNRFLATGKPRVVDAGRVELAALRKSGEEFPVELNITSVDDKDGTKFIAYIRDISERKINEQKLIDARDRAERTDKAKSQFLTVMSHEMRTPLNGVMGVLDLLRTTNLTDAQMRYAEIATASSEILLEHVNEALDITRIETGTLQLTPQDFDLPDLLNNLVDVLEPLAREKGLRVSLEISDAMRMGFHGDNNRVRQILTNLIGNAIKFTDAGSIALAVTGIHGTTSSSVKFAVTDTGAGITLEEQEQIFEEFVALAHSEGRQTRGDGLGLAISRRIAREMGGDIAVVSAKNVGSTFTLTIPLSRQTAGNLEKKPKDTKPKAISQDARQVLVVEDNDINRRILRDMLQGIGHHVTEAVNGVDCLEKAEMQRFDIIFMDISMPIMDGIEATERLRAGSGLNAASYIVGLTAHGREEYRERGESAGMSSFHTKPIRLSALNKIITGGPRPVSDAQAAAHDLPEELRELAEVLGAAKVQATVDKFFVEVATFIADVRSGEAVAIGLDFAEAAHKLKGGAAMLGQHDVAAPLAELEDLARENALSNLPTRMTELQRIAEKATADMATAFAKARD